MCVRVLTVVRFANHEYEAIDHDGADEIIGITYMGPSI